MTQTKYIQGAGGGGGKGGGGGSTHTYQRRMTLCSPYSLPTFLTSSAKARLKGLDDGNKSIFLDDTAVQNADGTNNFAGYTVITRNGKQAQNHTWRFNAVERNGSWC